MISNAFANDLLKLIFNATGIANLADNAGSSPLTNLYIALHTADPGAAGNQSTSEVTYTGYSRQAVARTTGGWTVTTTAGVTSASPNANVAFGSCTSGTMTATYVGIGTLASGTGKLLYVGALSPSIPIAPGVNPTITTASTISED